MPDYNLGTATGKISVKYDGSGVEAAKKSIGSLGDSAEKTRAGFQKIALASGAVAGGIAAGFVLAANKAIDFEKQISGIAAVSGATGKDIDLLRKKALQLGADTVFSASQAAQAMEELAKAGVSLPDILNGAADAAVNLAAAGGIDLADAADIAANAMNQFRLSAAQMPHVADLIAGAANASSIDVKDFGLSLQQAGAVANIVGVSFDDLATAIALMGKAGIRGSDAGTSLKQMLLNLNPVTTKQKDLFKDLNLTLANGKSAFQDAHGNYKSLGEIAGILQDRLKNMTAAQKTATLETIFGSDAIRAAAVLTQAGAKGFEDMAGAMKKVSAADVARKRLDNVAGSIEQLKGSLETAAITVGSLFLPTIRKVADILTRLTNAFSKLDPRWQKLIAFALLAVAALAGLVAIIATIGFLVLGIGAAFTGVAAAVIGAVLGIVAVIGILVAGFILLFKRSQAFRDMIVTAFNAFKRVVAENIKTWTPFVNFVRNTIIPLIGRGIAKAIDALKPAFDSIKNAINKDVIPAAIAFNKKLQEWMPTIEKVAKFIATFMVTTVIILAKVLSVLIPIIIKIAEVSFAWAKITIGVVVASLMAIWQAGVFVFNAIKTGLSALASVWSAIWGTFGPLVMSIFSLIGSIISASIAVILAIVTPAFNFIKSLISGVMSFLAPFVQATWNIIVAAFQVATSLISAIVTPAFNIVRNIVSGVMTAISAVISATWGFIQQVFSAGVAAIVGIINGVKAIVDRIRSFFDQLRGAAEGGVGSLISFVSGIPGRILAALGNLGGLLVNAGKQIVQGLANGIANAVGEVVAAAKRVVDAIPSTITHFLGISSPSKVTRGLGREVPAGLALGILDHVDLVRRAAADAAAAVSAVLGNLPVDSSLAVSAAVSGVSGGAGGSNAGASTTGGVSGTPAIQQTFNVPPGMNAKEIATYSARRLNLALSGASSSGSA